MGNFGTSLWGNFGHLMGNFRHFIWGNFGHFSGNFWTILWGIYGEFWTFLDNFMENFGTFLLAM